MPLDPATLYGTPNALASEYSRFRVGERLLLTGHSHQAWPDRAFEGQRAAFDDAALLVDDKWERAFEKAARVRAGFARLLGDREGSLALASNTHELLVRFLSALPLLGGTERRQRPRIVTTDAEFHSARRQLDRLAEAGVELVRVAAAPAASAGERVAAAIDDRTAAAIVSTVFFTDAGIAGGLELAAEACARHGAELLLDAYHQLNVVPFSLAGVERAFVVGGGYKYCQLGEGNAFLRVPPGCRLRPVVTGWFAEFAELAGEPRAGTVGYPNGGARFAGATYDPVSHYRGARVFGFFAEHGLTPDLLRKISLHQVGLLADRFDAIDAPEYLITRDRDRSREEFGGFLALRSPFAPRLRAGLAARGLQSDSRGEFLRLGP
ncbi:MAG TPA: kynureninase, partial [Thermoanaerobaculia bacterium]|nr:kynureninase [Thermoanaerobaculia bacterium]